MVNPAPDTPDVTEFKNSLATESKFRYFKLECEDGTLFVNGSFLADLSNFFDMAFFGSFSEAKSHSMSLQMKNKDVLEFLAVVYGRKNVDEHNCAAMIKLSDQWDMPSLQTKCKQYLNEGFYMSTPSIENSINILETALSSNCKHLVEPIVGRIACATTSELNTRNLLKRITDTSVVAAIYQARHLNKEVGREHEFRIPSNEEYNGFGGFGGYKGSWGDTDIGSKPPPPPSSSTSTDRTYRRRSRPPATSGRFGSSRVEAVNQTEDSGAKRSRRCDTVPTCNYLGCNAQRYYRCETCGLEFCTNHSYSIACPKNEKNGENGSPTLKVVPYKINQVPVDKELLFQK